MSARFRLLRVAGKGRSAWADAAVADYGKRLSRHGGFEEVLVKPEPFRGDVEAVRVAEAQRLLARVGPRDVAVALDERGLDLSTERFAAQLDGWRQEGSVCLLIGGPYGHGEAARDQARAIVRLSSMVLNHELARVVVVEQLYRAATLLAGVPYHH